MNSRDFLFSADDSPGKKAVLQSALRLFAEKGIDGVSIRDIGIEAGYTNPAMFRHFASKDELAQVLFEACYRRFALTLLPARQGDMSLRAFIDACVQLIEQAPEAVHFVLENLRRCFRALPKDLRALSLLGTARSLIETEKNAGHVRTDVDVDLAAAVLLGTLAQIARMAHFGELKRKPSELATSLWTLLNEGIGG